MTDDEDVFLPLEFEDDRFEADHDVAVRLAAAVAVVELVVVARVVVFGIVFLRSRNPNSASARLRGRYGDGPGSETRLDLFVGHAVANTRIELVERLPRQLLVRQLRSRLNRPLQRRSPDLVGSADVSVPSLRTWTEGEHGATHRERLVANLFLDERRQRAHVLLALLRQRRVSSNLALDVVLRLAVL